MDIRLAKKKDIDALVEFNQAMALETEAKVLNEDVLRAGVSAVLGDSGRGFYVVADDNGQIAGGLLVTFEWSDWRNAWFWWIQSVYIPEAYRGRSIYTRMYEFVKAAAEKQGNVCGFRLYVEKENQHAQRVYEKLGMKETYYLMYEETKK